MWVSPRPTPHRTEMPKGEEATPMLGFDDSKVYIYLNRWSLEGWSWVNFAAVILHLITILYMIISIATTGSRGVPVYVTSLTGRPGAVNTTVSFESIGEAHPRWIALAFELICVFMHAVVYPQIEWYETTKDKGGLPALMMKSFVNPGDKRSKQASSIDPDKHVKLDGQLEPIYYGGVVARQHNPYRWAEYSVSASLIFTGIQLITGVVDLSALASAFAANFAVMWFGWWSERANTQVFKGKNKEKDEERPQRKNEPFSGMVKSTAVPFVLGSVVALGPWIGVIVSVAKVKTGVPEVALAAMGSLAGFFFSFAQVEFLYVKQPLFGWDALRMSFVDKEVYYTILSCFSKVTLSILIFFASQP